MPKTNHQRGYRENLGHRRCSCDMCGNPRRCGWNSGQWKLTRQEQRALLGDEDYHPPGKKRGKKPFGIRKRSVRRDGSVSEWWTEIRRYRTREGRDNALAAMRRGVWRYPDGDPRYQYEAEASDD